jgi:hydroxyacylglutathione hydrolase
MSAMNSQTHTHRETCTSYRILPLNAVSLPDNYIWLLRRDMCDACDGCAAVAVVDPGEAQAVLDYLQREKLQLTDVLITHHHADHVGGVVALRRQFPQLRVHGPAAEAIEGVTERLKDGDVVDLPRLGVQFQVLAVPGHTLGHITYYDPNYPAGGVLFSGDTLFSAGCGRVFERTMAQMQHSLARLRALPEATQVYCAHEYTAANLRFALAVEPGNPAVAERMAQVAKLRADGRPSLPTTLALERQINPFLRWDESAVQQAAVEFERRGEKSPLDVTDPVTVFAAIRAWKNVF